MEHPFSALAVLVLALIHFWGGRMPFIGGLPRSVWLSMAGGVAVAYVFLHLFPELHEGQEHMERNIQVLEYLKHHIYLVALIGLSVFYGLESLVMSEKRQNKHESKEESISDGVFWTHIGSFALYNALIGYLLFRREEGELQELILFSIAMALHFIVNDYGLQEHHRKDYHKVGRWILVGSLLLGWVTGLIIEVSQTIVFLVLAFVGGGVVLNVLKEELPEERASRFWAFALGAGAYSVLLLSL